MKRLGSYINGNYRVSIFDDGTKIRENNLDYFRPAMPESMDIKITDQCECGCPYCHENSTPDGRHGDIMNAKFVDTLHPYTELAIGGGNPMAHPDLIPFLKKCKVLKLIPSMTVNQKHFMENYNILKQLSDDELIYGLGVSLVSVNDDLITQLQGLPNTVLHVINGVVSVDDMRRLYDKDLKVLILGYKVFRRGESYYSDVVEKMKDELADELPNLVRHFKVVSFDNLAIKQLDPKRLLSDEEWDAFYMGDDGQFAMYIDMVKEQFAISSTSTERWPVMDDIAPMFERVQTR